MRSSTGWARAFTWYIMLCSWERHSTFTLLLSIQMYEWVLVNLMLGLWGGGGKGGNPVMDQCPIHGDQISQNKYYLSIFEIYTQFKILVLCFLFYVQGSMNGQRG